MRLPRLCPLLPLLLLLARSLPISLAAAARTPADVIADVKRAAQQQNSGDLSQALQTLKRPLADITTKAAVVAQMPPKLKLQVQLNQRKPVVQAKES